MLKALGALTVVQVLCTLMAQLTVGNCGRNTSYDFLTILNMTDFMTLLPYYH